MTSVIPKIIIGLGNPGQQYVNTPHNVGFMVIDRLLQENKKASFCRHSQWQSLFYSWYNILLVKPQTYMNLSGAAVLKIMRFYRVKPTEVLIVYDDVNLPLGKIRFKNKGSAGGHNGIKSIITHLETENFPRLKIGVNSEDNLDLKTYVLTPFSAKKNKLLQNVLATIQKAMHTTRVKGIEYAANFYN